MGFPGGSDGEESAHNSEDLGLIPGSDMATPSSIIAWRIPWWAIVHGVTKNQTRLCD